MQCFRICLLCTLDPNCGHCPCFSPTSATGVYTWAGIILAARPPLSPLRCLCSPLSPRCLPLHYLWLPLCSPLRRLLPLHQLLLRYHFVSLRLACRDLHNDVATALAGCCISATTISLQPLPRCPSPSAAKALLRSV